MALIHADLGIQAERLMTLLDRPGSSIGTPIAQALVLYDELSDPSCLPAWSGAGVGGPRARDRGSASGGSVTVEGFTPVDGDASESNFNVVGPGCFRTSGNAPRLGRELTRDDELGGAEGRRS